jgi:four helix bundle protein
MNNSKFSFEDLKVWQKAIDFADKVTDIIDKLETDRKHYRLIENLESAAVSVASNIAEGKGRYSKKEFIQFLYIARGSLYETITQLTIFYKREWIQKDQLEEIKSFGAEIGKQISSLINSVKNSIN